MIMTLWMWHTQEEEGRRHSRTAWGGEWPLVDGGVWTQQATVGGDDKSADKTAQDGKDPKTLGPGVEVVTIPTPSRDRLYNKKLVTEITICFLIIIILYGSFSVLHQTLSLLKK